LYNNASHCTIKTKTCKLGILGGLNLANFSWDPEPEGLDLSNRTVFGFGGVLDYSYNEFVAVHLQLM